MRQSPNTQSAQTLPVSELEVNWHSHSKLNARASDQHYKYHVARMAKLYKEQGHKGAVDTSMPRTMAKPPPAVVESHKAHEYAVYGGDGAEAAGAGPSAAAAGGGKSWDKRFTVGRSLTRGGGGARRPRSAAASASTSALPLPVAAAEEAAEHEAAAASAAARRRVRAGKQRAGTAGASSRRRRAKPGGGGGGATALAAGVDEEQLILDGGYALSKQQADVYSAFTRMLAEFDLYTQVNILEDALGDAQSHTLLADYFGSQDA